MIDDGRIFVGLAVFGIALGAALAGGVSDTIGIDARSRVSFDTIVERDRRLRRIERMVPVIGPMVRS